MKNEYLDELKEILTNHDVSESDIKDILSDYEQMYEEGLDKDMSDHEIRSLLGEPKTVYEDLKDTLSFIVRKHGKNKFVALSPFLAVITFLAIGLSTNIWHPTWLVFMLIPISGVLSSHSKGMIVGLSPFVALITFMLVGTYLGYWEYAWLAFLLVPILGFLFHPTKKNIFVFLSLIVAIAFYVYMVYVYNEIRIGALGFILPILVSISFKKVTVEWNINKMGISTSIFTIFYILVFLLIGFLVPNGWGFSWMILLLIPTTAVILSGHFRWVAIMPFLATIIFFSLGYFFQLFEYSWMAFFLIPITGILEGKK